MADEETLSGGRITVGVVRVGDEVRRPVGPHSDFVHLVLRELEYAGFDGAPRFLGIDEHGRERLSYLPGWVAPDLAHGAWRDEQLLAVAELVRRVHDALSHSGLPGEAETVCHNDLGPCNAVHVNGTPRAFIDWDRAAPGPRVYDLAHAAWRWAIISDTEELPLDEQVRRVRLMCHAYGDVGAAVLLDAVLANQDRVIEAAERRGDSVSSSWHRGEREWFAAHREAFARGLRCG
jgi:aminoglycoside phosphotransferase (APT) family kinase protein